MFYVYQLVDPRSRLPFYVGKGKGTRAWSHAAAARRGKSTGNPRKDALIADLLSSGMEPTIVIVAKYQDQAEAFAHEIELISASVGLFNIRKGGEGWGLSLEEAERRLAARRDEKNIAFLSGWLSMAEKWPNGCTVHGHRNGDLLGAEYMRIVRELVSHANAA